MECSASQASPAGCALQEHGDDSAAHGDFLSDISAIDPVAHAQRRTAQLAAVLSTTGGQALVQRHLGQTTVESAHTAQRQIEQFTAMLSTDAGKAALQKQLSSYLQRKQQLQAAGTGAQSPTAADCPAARSPATYAVYIDGSIISDACCSAEASGDSAVADMQTQISSGAAAAKLAATANKASRPAIAQIWTMLQQQQQKTPDALNPAAGLTCTDTQMSSVRQEAAESFVNNRNSINRGSSQVVFKRRAHNSSTLRRHVSNQNKAAAVNRTESNASGHTTGPSKPHQLFKKQRKRPLMLWSNNSNLVQQIQAVKQEQQQQQEVDKRQCAEDGDYSCTSGSSGVASSAEHAVTAAISTQLTMAAAATAAAPVSSTGLDIQKVLATLAHQEQQLMVLQQQLKQQRELITGRRAAQPQGAAAAAAADMLRQLLRNMQAATSDVHITDAWNPAAAVAHVPASLQQQVEVPAASEAASALATLTKLFIKQQQQQQMDVPIVQHIPMASQGQSWNADILRQLTAALLAA